MNFKKDEKGQLMLEAAIIYPMLIIILVFLLYIILLCAQRAQIVSAAEQTMVYIKYICSGNYDVSSYENMQLSTAKDGDAKIYNVYANLFDTPTSRMDELNEGTSGFGVKDIFEYYLKTPLLANIEEDFEITATAQNYVLFTQLDLTVTYTMNQFLNFSFIGGESMNNPTFTVHVQGVISDQTETIRTLQYVDFFVVRTGLDKKIDEAVGKIGDAVGKVKSWLGGS